MRLNDPRGRLPKQATGNIAPFSRMGPPSWNSALPVFGIMVRTLVRPDVRLAGEVPVSTGVPPRIVQAHRTPIRFLSSLHFPLIEEAKRHCFADDQAGFNTTPSGMTPWVAYRHRAISSLRASATIRIFFMRPLAPPRRSRNHFDNALSG